MADTSVQVDIARWICNTVLPNTYSARFSRREVSLSCGGLHSFAAVSDDLRTVGTICTGIATTAKGSLAVGKLNKVRAELYFLLLASAEHRFIAITDLSMAQKLEEEQNTHHRIPCEIELIHVPLPPDLAARLSTAQQVASSEVSPA